MPVPVPVPAAVPVPPPPSGWSVRDDGTSYGYKQGIHLHWPGLHVTTEKALQLRLAMIEGLYQAPCIAAALGFREGDLPNWEEMVDESVYNNGLRMVGSPKAKRCECKGKSDVFSCVVCKMNNRQHVIDPACYGFRLSLEHDGREDAGYSHRLRENFMYLLKNTSVRLGASAKETPGFTPYEGAPVLPHRVSKEQERKRERRSPTL